MNRGVLTALTDEGLNLEAQALDKEISRAGQYESIKNDVNGILLLKEMHSRRELSRDLYRHINPHHQSALTALIQLQAAETETMEWLARVQHSPDHIKELRARRSSLGELVKMRKESRVKSRQFALEAPGKGTKKNDTRRDGNSDKG